MADSVSTEPVAIRYRAFLSYGHADTAWAKRLHAALERFPIDAELKGRPTPLGPVPAALRPIFRDRDDFSGGHALTDATVAALDASSALLVLCSPVAASRPAVNEEVRLFRHRHPQRPVIPVVIDGTWPDNYPPALRYELAADGTVTDRPVTILGPDLRESGDGWHLGLAKAIAGLIGVPPDEIFRRAERERRRKARVRHAIAGVFVALVATGGFFAWRSHQTQLTLAEKQAALAEVEALVAKYDIANASQDPNAGAGLANAITAIATGAATDARYARALALLRSGKPADAEPLLKAVADETAARARSTAKQAADAYRNLGAIARLADPKRAREHYARALEFEPDHPATLLWAGWLDKDAGNLAAAERAFHRLIALQGQDGREAFSARLGLGDIRASRGDLPAAMTDYQQAQATARRFADARPDDTAWRRGLALASVRAGDVLIRQGKVDDALKAFRDSLAVSQRLTAADPSNANWQRDLYMALWHVADAEARKGELAPALEKLRAGAQILDRLLAATPDSADIQRERAVARGKIGDVLLTQGKLLDALTSFRDGLAISERLANADPANHNLQRDLSVRHYKLGDALMMQGKLDDAMPAFEAGRAIAERLTKADPANAGWLFDLGIGHERIGAVFLAKGDQPGALAAYLAKQDIIAQLTKRDPSNTEWQRDLWVATSKVGQVLVTQGKLDEALASFGQGLAIAERIAKADAANASRQFDFSTALWNVADVNLRKGNLAAALDGLQSSQDIMERLVKSDPLNASWQRQLAVSYSKLGDLLVKQGRLPDALKSLRDSLSLHERLAKADPANAQSQWDVVVMQWRLAVQNDEPLRRWSFVVGEIARLKREGRLRPDWERFLPSAEANLAKAKAAPAPQ